MLTPERFGGMPLKRPNQNGINMVDLMMWLVIAALLLAAAIQGIGYYQKAAYLYQMKSDLTGAGQNTVAKQGQAYDPGKLDEATVTEAAADTRWTANMAYSVEMDASDSKPFIRATHPGIDDKDGIYLFESCGEVFKVGVNIIPKGTSPDLGTCTTVTTPVDIVAGPPAPDADGDGIPDATDPDIDGDGTPNGSDPTPNGDTTTPPATDTDGDGIPNATDPDIDGDGTPNGSDPTPNGETGGTTPVSTKCSNLSVEAEVSCWHDEYMAAQTSYETANGHYFGLAQYSNQPSYAFSPPEMEGTPLKYGGVQETYRDTPNTWDYNYHSSAIVDRDGFFWRGGYYHELFGEESYANTFAKDMNNTNYKYACDFVTPADLNSLCTWVGTHQEKYVATSANSDPVAHADIKKVIDAQLTAAQGGGLYGGYETPTDVTSWAGTSYTAKVWNFEDASNYYTRVMVIAPNGDVFTSQQRYWKTDPRASTYQNDPVFNAIRSYKYTNEHVNRVCSMPFINNYNQTSDIGTCKTLGYADFHP